MPFFFAFPELPRMSRTKQTEMIRTDTFALEQCYQEKHVMF